MSMYDEDMAVEVGNLRQALTNDDDEGVLDNVLYQMKEANNMEGETTFSWIAVSLHRIADALDRMAPAQEGGK